MSRWKAISESEARAHPLYGVGGWLSLFFAGLAFLLILYVMVFVQTTGLWGEPPHKFFLPFVLVESCLVVALLILGANKIPTYRTVALVTIPIIGVIELITAPFSSYILTGEEISGGRPALGTWSLVWFFYFIYSRRVQVTFAHAVSAKESETDVVETATDTRKRTDNSWIENTQVVGIEDRKQHEQRDSNNIWPCSTNANHRCTLTAIHQYSPLGVTLPEWRGDTHCR